LRGLPVDARRVRLLLTLVLAFFSGALIGTWMFQAMAYAALYLPAAATGLVGTGYALYSHLKRARAEE
jgi:uncharacterized membrane protein YoaK (UPF0700 family)